MRAPRGSILLLTLLFIVLLCRSRAALSHKEPPAFFVEGSRKIPVLLGPGFRDPGIHQFLDDTPLSAVINMAERPAKVRIGPEDLPGVPLRPGEALSLSDSWKETSDLTRGWMGAGQRVAMGIPLHPDRMSQEDWEYLPGIGSRLAVEVEKDRQENGDFGVLEKLDRVKGIGPKRIESWQEFFCEL